MDVSAWEELRKVQSGVFFYLGTIPYDARPPLRRKTLGEGGGGEVKVETENREVRFRNCKFAVLCRMSIMAFELPFMEMAFALSEFEYKVFT